MRKLLAIILSSILILGLASCGGAKDPQAAAATSSAVEESKTETFADEYDKVAYEALKNGGFDNGMGAWSQEQIVPLKFTDDKKEGEASLLIDVLEGKDCHMWQSMNFSPKPGNPAIGDRVMGSFWIKLDENISLQEGKLLLFKVEAYSQAGGKKILASVKILGDEKKGEWIYIETPVGEIIEDGTETLTAAFEDDLKGKVYLDDVKVYKVVPKGEGTAETGETGETGTPYTMNSGFEETLDPWGIYVDKAEPVAAVDGGKDSTKTLLMDNKTEGFTAIWNTINITADATTPSIGDTVKATAWIKLGEGTAAAEGKKCYFKLEHFSEAKGKTLIGGVDILGTEAKGEWFKVEIPVCGPIPAGEETVTVAFENGLPGKIYVDEVKVICVTKGDPAAAVDQGMPYTMNSGFEETLDPWGTYVDKADPVAAVDGGKDSAKALLMNNKTEGFTAIWNTVNITTEASTPSIGDAVKATAWIKLGDGVAAVEGKKCYFKLEHFSEAKGKTLIGGFDILGTEAKGEWIKVEIPAGVPIPAGEETVTVAFENGLPGKIYVDDVKIVK